MTNIKFEDGIISINLDDILNNDVHISASYQKHGRFGFSYEPYGIDLAEKMGLALFLQKEVRDPKELKGVSLSTSKNDIGVSISFLRGFLLPIIEFSSNDEWIENFEVSVSGRYESTTELSVEAFKAAERETMTSNA